MSFPPDEPTQKPSLTAFMGYKAGMTHVLRLMERPGNIRLNKKEVVDAVTVVETPPMIVVGMKGYKNTTRGLQVCGTVWAEHVGEGVKRRLTPNYTRSKKLAFGKVAGRDYSEAEKNILENADVVRAYCATQPNLISCLNQKRSHLAEIQVNGGSTADKVKFVKDLFEQEVKASDVYEEGEISDVISISKGHGMTGVITRWGVSRLQRKTHRGLRKVACIGSWHPARCEWTVPRAGQRGYHQRTEHNARVLRIGSKDDPRSGCTETDITEKTINPMSGFGIYGPVKNDFVMLKGPIVGAPKRVVTLRKPIRAPTARKHYEPVNLKFIDTSSKKGTGRFQTSVEKRQYFGPLKKHRLAAANL